MRGRRNTNLSLSSSATWTPSHSSHSSRSSRDEKLAALSPPMSPTSIHSPPTRTSRSSRLRWQAAVRWVGLLAACAVLWNHCRDGSSSLLPNFLSSLAGGEKDSITALLANTTLPADPSTIIVSDKSGQYRRWTISIPPYRAFPLDGDEYEDLCGQCEAMRDSLAPSSRLFQAEDWKSAGGLYAVDRTFLDVDRAESLGVLAPSSDDYDKGSEEETCERSLTFVFDENEASFGKSLLLLWMSYGLAKKEGRAFFIDDSQWGYGTYTSFFTPTPSPGCRAPPSTQIVPCPHSANHLVVSSATAPWTFGPAFDRTFSRSLPQAGAEKSRRIFDLLRAGYEDLFHLIGDDASYAAARAAELKEVSLKSAAQAVVGMHIRRGDRHPVEYQFSRDYLPLERYVDAARSLAQRNHNSSSRSSSPESQSKDSSPQPEAPIMLLASDDPALLSPNHEINQLVPSNTSLQPAQSRIQLATKAALQDASSNPPPPPSSQPPWASDPTDASWEGGFYKALFFSLGKPLSKNAIQPLKKKHPHLFRIHRPASSPSHGGASSAEEVKQAPRTPELSEQGRRLRHLVGRAYLLDLAVLAQAPGGVVCAVSSASCRVLGVMMGWDAVANSGISGAKAAAGASATGADTGKGKVGEDDAARLPVVNFGETRKKWVNVDDGRAWSWDGRRV